MKIQLPLHYETVSIRKSQEKLKTEVGESSLQTSS